MAETLSKNVSASFPLCTSFGKLFTLHFGSRLWGLVMVGSGTDVKSGSLGCTQRSERISSNSRSLTPDLPYHVFIKRALSTEVLSCWSRFMSLISCEKDL